MSQTREIRKSSPYTPTHWLGFYLECTISSWKHTLLLSNVFVHGYLYSLFHNLYIGYLFFNLRHVISELISLRQFTFDFIQKIRVINLFPSWECLRLLRNCNEFRWGYRRSFTYNFFTTFLYHRLDRVWLLPCLLLFELFMNARFK